MILDIIITAATPGIALAIAYYVLDRYNREPAWLLIKLFLLGMVISLPILVVEMILSFFNVMPGILSVLFMSFVVAGLTEEFFKRLVVLKVAYKHPAFDERLDGIIYAVFVSLGFATLENILYVAGSYAEMPHLWITRALLSVPGHMLMAVTMGYFIALAKYAHTKLEEEKYKLFALIFPVLFHGTFNTLLSFNSIILWIVFLGFVLFLWIINMKRLRKLYKQSKSRHEAMYGKH